jgi:putative membrane protein
MISYDTKAWLGVFQIHKADTFRKLLPLIIAMAAYTALIVYLEKLFNFSKDSPLHNITSLHGLVGFALSMLLVFRTNTAYDRWWEGRRHWGALVNSSRNLALKLTSLLPNHPEERSFFASAIPRFAFELMAHLREESTRLEMDERPHPEIPDFDRREHVPAQVSALIINRVQKLRTDKLLSAEDLLFMNAELTSFMDICGACERIRNTPIPFSYSAFIKKFIFIYVTTLPFGFAFSLGYLSIPIVALIFYILGSLEIIAEEIEEPFGADQNDLPMQRLCVTIQKSVREIFD